MRMRLLKETVDRAGEILALSASSASAADALKVAVGRCGNWDSSPVQLATAPASVARHGI